MSSITQLVVISEGVVHEALADVPPLDRGVENLGAIMELAEAMLELVEKN